MRFRTPEQVGEALFTAHDNIVNAADDGMCLKPPRKKWEAEQQSFSLFTSSKRTKRARGRGDVSLKGVGGWGDWRGVEGASP